MNQVKIIADSKSPYGQRLITAILTFPRYLLAEVNTHRMLSRNSASSRAIRFEKMVQSVMENPFIPMKWQKDHPGMQGTEYFDLESQAHTVFPDLYDEISEGLTVKEALEGVWLEARNSAVDFAKELHNHGVTKQLANRQLEPYMMHTALVSGTELENFFALRAEDGAEIHFQDLAYKFLDAVNQSEPKQLKAGEWHIPFGDDIDEAELAVLIADNGLFHGASEEILKIKIATVRAARISYATPGSEMKHDYEADLKLHDRLASSGHFSCFEHCARVMNADEYNSRMHKANGESGWCGNFRGFIQYRRMFDNENRNDNRLIKK